MAAQYVKASAMDADHETWFEASRKGDRQTIEVLLAKGFDCNAKNGTSFACENWTALHYCALSDFWDITKLLLENGARVDEKDRWDWTPLMVACANGKLETYDLLIAHGADINARNNVGRTPLICAVVTGQDEITRRLVKLGSNVNAMADDGRTPLTWAAYYGHETIAAMLMECRQFTAIDQEDYLNNKTALQYAIEKPNCLWNGAHYPNACDKIASLLKSKGAALAG